MTSSLLSVEDLKIEFDTYDGVVEALDGVTFEILEGEIFGLVGETVITSYSIHYTKLYDSRHTPALPLDHPFKNVRDVYWSSTTSFFEPDWAWALYLNKGATGVGFKQEKTFHLWPVAAGSNKGNSF